MASISDLLRDLEETWRRPSRQLESDAYWLLRRNLEAGIMRIER